MRRPARALLALLLLVLAALPTSLASTPAGTVIANRASAAFRLGGRDATASSPTVRAEVAEVCAPALAAPLASARLLPGGEATFPVALRNDGNAPAAFGLALEVAAGAAPVAFALFRDLDGDGAAGAGDPELPASGPAPLLAPGEEAALLVVASAPADADERRTAAAALTAACAAGASARSSFAAELALDGAAAFAKTASPASGASVAPGGEIAYRIELEVADEPLAGAVLSDPLDPLLEAPIGLALRVDGALAPDAATWDAASRTVRAALPDPLAPGARVALELRARVRADAPAGATVANVAELAWRGPDGPRAEASPAVLHTVAAVCALRAEALAERVTALPGEVASVPFLVANDGNAPADLALALAVDPTSDLAPASLRLVLDVDGDGVADDGEPEAAAVPGLAPGASARLAALVAIPADPGLAGEILASLSAAAGCSAASPPVRVIVPLGGFSAPTKSAEPAAGVRVAPGQPVRYTVRFAANGRDLTDVVVRDPLPAALAPPTSWTSGGIVDADGRRAEASFAFADGVAEWRLARVPAGMTVELHVTAPVRSDAAPGTALVNVACVESAAGASCSNAVPHEVAPVVLTIEKGALADVAAVGGSLDYEIAVAAAGAVGAPRLEVADRLPEGLRFEPGSAEILRADGASSPFEPVVAADGRDLLWRVGALAAGETVRIRFRTRVLPAALEAGEVVNVAEARARGADDAVIAVASDAAATSVAGGALDVRAVLLGTVFVDADDDGRFDAGVDEPVGGVRVLLPDGRAAVSDADGRWALQGLEPGPTSLKVDPATLPGLALRPTPTEAAPGLWSLRLHGGAIHRRDVPLRAPGGLIAADAELELAMGPLGLVKRAGADAEGRAVVELTLRSDAPLRGLVIRDPHPAGGAPGRFDVPELAAGETRVLRWSPALANDDPPLSPRPAALTVPEVAWSVRP